MAVWMVVSGDLQAIVAVSVVYVWGLNFRVMTEEWPSYGLPDWVRVVTGIAKLAASVLLVVGLVQPVYALVGAVIMAVFMSAAVLVHLFHRDPVVDTLPSLALAPMAWVVVWLNRLVLGPW